MSKGNSMMTIIEKPPLGLSPLYPLHDKHINWIIEAIENVVYQDKPLPPMS